MAFARRVAAAYLDNVGFDKGSCFMMTNQPELTAARQGLSAERPRHAPRIEPPGFIIIWKLLKPYQPRVSLLTLLPPFAYSRMSSKNRFFN